MMLIQFFETSKTAYPLVSHRRRPHRLHQSTDWWHTFKQ